MTSTLSQKKPTTAGLYAAPTISSAASSKTGLPVPSSRPRIALSAKKITVFQDDKENVDPSGRKKSSSDKKDKSKLDIRVSSGPPKTDLWKGKQPFDFASPEKEHSTTSSARSTYNKSMASSKHIYDLPGIQATSHVTSASSQASTKIAKPSMRTVASGSAVSRPNKKSRALPPPLKKTSMFEIFSDEQRQEEVFLAPRMTKTTTSTSASTHPSSSATISQPERMAMKSPISFVKDSDRKARELIESPLADVTLAYTGRGRFSNSPTVSGSRYSLHSK